MSTETFVNTNKIVALLCTWLKTRISESSWAWLERKRQEITQNEIDRNLFTAFSSASRYLGKQPLALSSDELQNATELITGWNPIDWTVDQVGRTVLILSFPQVDEERYIATLDKIFAAADVGEAIALYQSLPILPYPEKFKLRAAEGVRSNMSSVFNAIALNNPYPAQYLDDLAWNQMILKALFINSPLKPIYGLKSRNNAQLSQMLIDYAHERLAAHRTVNPELWQLVAAFNSQAVAELKPAFNQIEESQRLNTQT